MTYLMTKFLQDFTRLESFVKVIVSANKWVHESDLVIKKETDVV